MRLTEWQLDVQEMVIGEEDGNEWNGDLVISNYPHLKRIQVGETSLQNLRCVKICNNPKLKKVLVGPHSFRNVTHSFTLSGSLNGE